MAEEYSPFSAYNYTLNNPVRNIDPDGRGVEDLIVRGDRDKAFEDILSTVAPKYRDRISIDDDGLISVNTDGLKLQEITGEVDSGLGTLIGMVESNKNYVYGVRKNRDVYKVSGEVVSEPTDRFPDFPQSLYHKQTGEQQFDNLGTETIGGEEVPIHGRADIHPGMRIYTSSGYPIDRSALVVHVLEEVYQRADFRRRGWVSHKISKLKAERSFHLKIVQGYHGYAGKFKVN